VMSGDKKRLMLKKIGDKIVVKFPYKIDIRTSSDILPKWNDIQISHIQSKSEGYTNQFGYNSLYEIALRPLKVIKQKRR